MKISIIILSSAVSFFFFEKTQLKRKIGDLLDNIKDQVESQKVPILYDAMNTDDCLEYLNASVDNVAKTLVKNDPFLQFVPEEEVYQLKQDLAPKFANSFVTSFFFFLF